MNWKKKFAIFSAFAGTTIAAIHVLNRIVSFNASKDNKLRLASGFNYNWKFGKIFYKKTGVGTPLLLVHDLKSFSSSEEWNSVIGELSKKHTVYAIDLLGCGRSEKPNILYTNYLFLQLVTDFVKQVIGSKTDVVAMGQSSSFVLAACHDNPSLINRIVMVSPCSIKALQSVPNKRTKILSWLTNLPLKGTLLYHILNRKSRIRAFFNSDYFYLADSFPDNMLDVYFEAAHVDKSGSKHLFTSIEGNYTTIHLTSYMKGLNNSIYIITGDNKSNNREIIEEYQSKLPSIEAVQINACGGLPQADKPKEFLDHLRIFLS